jgi:hypothetical protein
MKSDGGRSSRLKEAGRILLLLLPVNNEVAGGHTNFNSGLSDKVFMDFNAAKYINPSSIYIQSARKY